MAAYELRFEDRKKKMLLEFGALGFPLDLSQYHGKHEPADLVPWESNVITAMAHRIDGVTLSVE